MAGRIEHHAHPFLRLECREARARGERLLDRGVEIVDLHVEVQHLLLVASSLRPPRCATTAHIPRRERGTACAT